MMETTTAGNPEKNVASPAAERIQVEAMLSEGGGVSTFTADPPRGAPMSAAPPAEMSTTGLGSNWAAERVGKAVRRFGYYCLRNLAHSRGRVSESLRELADDAHRRAEQTRLALGLIDDFKDGTYRQVPWSSIAILASALLYVANPRDLVPDFIPLLGDLDDITVLTLAIRATQKDLRAYCRFKGYRETDFFERAEV